MINIKKEEIPAVLEIALSLLKNTEQHLENGFRTSGLFPFNPNAVSYDLLNKK